MFRWILTLSLALVLWAQAVTPSQAQPLCGDHTDILRVLEMRHSEKRQVVALSDDGGLLEVLVSPSGGWTILVTYPDRATCVVAVGRDWATLSLAGDPA